MDDALSTILERADCEPPLFHSDEVMRWPIHSQEQWLGSGFLRTTTSAIALPCYGCGGEHVEKVVFIEDARGKRAYIPCPKCGPIPIDMERLRCWVIDFGKSTRAISNDLDCRGQIIELASQRLWRLGSANLGGHRRSVFFGRMLHHRDGRELLSRWRIASRGIVLAPSVSPECDAADHVRPMVLLLRDVIREGTEAFHLDRGYLEEEFASRENITSPKNALTKRNERAALIALLTEEMIEHIRTARDYARATERQNGDPKLLPRPTQAELARRVGSNQWSVSRCLADESARELRFLWDLAIDLNRILRHSD